MMTDCRLHDETTLKYLRIHPHWNIILQNFVLLMTLCHFDGKTQKFDETVFTLPKLLMEKICLLCMLFESMARPVTVFIKVII